MIVQISGMICAIANLLVLIFLTIWIVNLGKSVLSGANGLTGIIMMILATLGIQSLSGIALGITIAMFTPLRNSVTVSMHKTAISTLAAWLTASAIISLAIIIKSHIYLKGEKDNEE